MNIHKVRYELINIRSAMTLVVYVMRKPQRSTFCSNYINIKRSICFVFELY